MDKLTHKTIRIPMSYQEWLSERCFGSAGPGASISGMKNKYWGRDAYIVACGQYIYRVPQDVYYDCLYRVRDY